MWLEKSKGKNGMWVTKAMVDIGPDYAGPVGPVKILGLSLKVMRSHWNVLDSNWHDQIPVPLAKTMLIEVNKLLGGE